MASLLTLTLACGSPQDAAQGMTVVGGRVIDSGGHDFVMRGVNYPYAWYHDRELPFADQKKLGANTVRVVLSTGARWRRSEPEEVEKIISECWGNRLVCVLEVHDTTGYGEVPGATPLADAVDYWISLRELLAGTEHYVVINVGNEPYGNIEGAPWAQESISAIARLRAAGFPHLLMLDGPNWAQDWTLTMRDAAGEVLASDPIRNTLFSVHTYEVFADRGRVRSYLDSFVAARIPLIIGEFGATHPKGDPDEDEIMAAAQQMHIGYLGWSWSGNTGGYEGLDIVAEFDPERLTEWGERLFHGPHGIFETAREASVFAD